MFDRSLIEAIRARVRLDEIVADVQLRASGHDDLKGCCPFHNEKTPSFHVHPEKGFFKCFGCGAGGDVIDYISRRHGVPFHEAVEFLASRIGLATDAAELPAAITPRPRIETRAPSQTWLRLQSTLRTGTVAELSALAELRHLPSTSGLELATRSGQLFFADVWDDGYEWPCWIITDGSRRNAQARRVDGQPFAGIGGKKAKTISGCEARWPVGISEVGDKHIALVEGGPDFLAAWHFIWLKEMVGAVSPVAMFGAANAIHPDALPFFSNRTVWIFPHSDDNRAGEKAALQWKSQLGQSIVDCFPLREFGVKDLNDAVTLETAHQNQHEMEGGA